MHLMSEWLRMGWLASGKYEGIFEGIGQIPSNEIPSWHSLQLL